MYSVLPPRLALTLGWLSMIRGFAARLVIDVKVSKSALTVWAVSSAPIIACYLLSRAAPIRVNGNQALRGSGEIVQRWIPLASHRASDVRTTLKYS